MPDYLVMLLEDEGAHAALSPSSTAAHLDARAQFATRLRATGEFRDDGRFRPSTQAKRVRRRGDAIEVADGPFAPGGRALGSYYCVDAASLDQAAALAAACPTLPSDALEVRPVMSGRIDRDKAGKPGKVFGFAVLGQAKSEAAWREVMDRIDAETRGCFPPDAFLGGVRLEPPSGGRRSGERRATVDGPFLEGKEVIGGLFFVRLASVDDAVRWAAASRFVVHGTLEIRELWRS